MPRAADRAPDRIRTIEVIPDFIRAADGSVLYQCEGTRVVCVASLVAGTPPWLDDDEGWVTAEYALLPYSTNTRVGRSRGAGKLDGRTQEIQRLIGRSLRASVDRRRIAGFTMHIDCDVLEADGGTRTASITGATLALDRAVRRALDDGRLTDDPRRDAVIAISAGRVDGEDLLDLDYSEDHRAEIDLNIVGTPTGSVVEVQGTSESEPLELARWEGLIGLAARGLQQVGEAIAPWRV